ncbi:MAG: HIT family protein [Bacteroidales bacterium]|jgi:histidine triad (HIT) family protein|nr:HIT family protein [Bacteroidales bacterium]MBQ3740537.1 HIT family protein [Bacteroidales bacterium]MBR0305082.1 HIT family protein [Bacteroidales bacterium]MBR6334379.1 HIT family protein [Bacteroidales bacterium]
MEDTIFTKIVKGEIPCYKIAENDKFFAFLDISPIAKGHTLVITKLQNDYIFDLPDELLGEMMVFAKKVAVGIKKAIPCNRVGVAVIGIDVPHNHIHLVPINGVGDLNFKAERVQLTQEEFQQIAAQISCAVEL